MASVVDVCNRALDKLGHGPITSLTDGNRAANLCTRNWPLTRDQVLRDHPWNFAIKRTITAPLTTVPVFGFSYQHQIPSDLIRLLDVDGLSTNEYQREGDVILSDETSLYIRYVAQITDPNKYDSLFLNAVSTRLAFEMCEALTQSNTKKEGLWNEYQDDLTVARRVDAQENPPQDFEESDWILVRY